MKVTCLIGSPRRDGSTATIAREVCRALSDNGVRLTEYTLSSHDVKYCIGCKTCEQNGTCIQDDDVRPIIESFFASNLVIVASPSYWGDITGQLKAFIDRCTPYGNTNPARRLSAVDTVGAAIAVRAGQNPAENAKLVGTIEHFLGHLDIPMIDRFTVEGINTKKDLEIRPSILKEAYQLGQSLYRRLQ